MQQAVQQGCSIMNCRSDCLALTMQVGHVGSPSIVLTLHRSRATTRGIDNRPWLTWIVGVAYFKRHKLAAVLTCH
jgi:hypothetical protein